MAETSETEGEEIFSIFTKEENESLSEEARKKLGDAWFSKIKEIVSLKVEKDKIKINAGTDD